MAEQSAERFSSNRNKAEEGQNFWLLIIGNGMLINVFLDFVVFNTRTRIMSPLTEG